MAILGSAAPPVTIGRVCLSVAGAACAVGAFMADFNHTHVKNPRWPPHAKFHNGQTMSMSIALATMTLYYTWRPVSSISMARDSIKTAMFTGLMYYVTGLSAILYPGTRWQDPEFGDNEGQKWLFSGLGGMAVLGGLAELSRLNGK